MSIDNPGLYDRVRAPKYFRYIVQPLFYVISPVIVPLRVALLFIFIGTSSVFDFLLDFGTDIHKPLPKWRNRVYIIQKTILYRLALLSCGFIVFTKGKPRTDVNAIICNY